MCLPSSSSLPLTAAVFTRTFLLHFRAPRRLMSYPEIMKGETLLGFEIGAEHVSSSQFSHFLCLHLAFGEHHNTFTSVEAAQVCARVAPSTQPGVFHSFFLYHREKNPWSHLFGPLKRCTSHFSPQRAAICPRLLQQHQPFLLASLICLYFGTVH